VIKIIILRNIFHPEGAIETWLRVVPAEVPRYGVAELNLLSPVQPRSADRHAQLTTVRMAQRGERRCFLPNVFTGSADGDAGQNPETTWRAVSICVSMW
jgi:hypothetical protein